jgi:ABC-type glutathione transport system ATPase component
MIEQEICDGIRDIVEARGITVLAISHQPIWTTIADEVFVLKERKVVHQVPATSDVISTYSASA